MHLPLRFMSHYRVERVEPDQVFLIAENETKLLIGNLYFHLCPFLKEGNCSAEEIVSRLIQKASPEMIDYALTRLEYGGYIEKYDNKLTDEFTAFCHLLNIDPKTSLEKLSTQKVCIVGDETPEKTLLSTLLKPFNIELVNAPQNADLNVVIAEDYRDQNLKDYNDKFFKSKSPWMLLKPKGSEIWIGPLFEPGTTACYECLDFQLRKNRIEETYLQNKLNHKTPLTTSIGALELTKSIAFHLAALEIFKWLTSGATNIKGHIVSFNLHSLQSQEHQLPKLPYCACCGDPTQNRFQPIVLRSQPKTGINDGGYRSITPEETLKKYANKISPILGIVSSLSPRLVKENSALFVYEGGHNFALSYPPDNIMRKSFRLASAGKGKTDAQAKASCLCESIERYSGVFQGTEIRKMGSYQKLQEEAIHPKTFLLISEAQYHNRASHNKEAIQKHNIPLPFCEKAEIEWSYAWSLTEKKSKCIPTAFAYYGYPSLPETKFFSAFSNGAAAGNTLEEAVLQGFFELVERDSVAIWWYNRIPRPIVDLSTFNEPYFQLITAEYQSMGRDLWVLDITTDLNIPTFVSISANRQQNQHEILMGFGCHLDAKIAIERALTEMNQFLANLFISKKQYEGSQADQKDIIQKWLSQATIENQPYLKGAETERPRTANDYLLHTTTDLQADILNCQKILENEGLEILVLDQTRPEIGLKVVKVIVPGLRHFYPHFAPGRLYDVPVKLKWLKKPKLESEMNPIPMFL